MYIAQDDATIDLDIDKNGKCEVADVSRKEEVAAKPQSNWRLKFYGPSIDGDVSLKDIIDEIGSIIADLDDLPDDAPGTNLDDIWQAVDGDASEAVNVVVEKLGLSRLSWALSNVKFGNVNLSAEFKAAAEPDAKTEGTLSGIGVMVRVWDASTSATILDNADY